MIKPNLRRTKYNAAKTDACSSPSHFAQAGLPPRYPLGGNSAVTVSAMDLEGAPAANTATGNGPANTICNAIDRGIKNKTGKDGRTHTGRNMYTGITAAQPKARLSSVHRQPASNQSSGLPAPGSTTNKNRTQ